MRIVPAVEIALSVLVAASLVLGACSRDQKAPAQGPEGTVGRQQADGALRLVPENPSALDVIRANHGVAGKASYRWSVNGRVLDGENGPELPAGKCAKGDTVSVTVNIDGREISVSTKVVNSLPKVTSVVFSDPQSKDADVTFDPKAFDADGDPVRFRIQWVVNDQKLPEEGLAVPRSRFRKGDRVSITVTPYDADGEGEPYSPLPLVIPNAPPRFTSPPQAEFSASGYRYQAHADDPDGDPVTYSLSSAPPGMVIDSRTGMVIWALADARPGAQTVEIVARDPEGLKSVQRYTLTVTPPQEVEREK